jgi:hypothetical protein
MFAHELNSANLAESVMKQYITVVQRPAGSVSDNAVRHSRIGSSVDANSSFSSGLSHTSGLRLVYNKKKRSKD